MTWIILFWTSIFLLLYSYLIYPLILRVLAHNKPANTIIYKNSIDLPEISVIMSVYNEEKVLRKKVNSIFCSSYPVEKMEVIIGSDCSNDNTDKILEEMKKDFKNLSVYKSNTRIGKPVMLNKLFSHSKGKILIITDANVYLNESTIPNLVKHFKNPEIGLVDSRMVHSGIENSGISRQESVYISFEVNLKHREGLVWGTMMGPFGGCYAIRKDLFIPIPKRFLVDDFFLNMNTLQKRKKSLSEMDSIVTENVSNSLSEEFRRKKRIAAGNFQNLIYYADSLWPPFSRLFISFVSHKIIRWFGPLFFIVILISSLFLIKYNPVYQFFIYFYCLIALIVIIDLITKKFGKHIILFRFVTHFFSMNLALSLGLINFLKGIKSNVWEPTKRKEQ